MKSKGFILLAALAAGFVAVASPSLAADSSVTLTVTTATKTFSAGFKGELERAVADHSGFMGLSLKNLKTGEEVEVNGNEAFPTASTIKTAVMCAAFDALTSPTSPFKSYYDTKNYDASTSTGGSGLIHHFRDGIKIELKELIHLMMTISDNIATNMLVEWVGIDSVNRWLADRGFEHTRIYSTVGGKIIYDAEGRKEWGLGKTTPAEMRRLMEMIYEGKAGTTSTSEEMLRVLGHQYFDDLIAGEVPPTVWVGSKSGAVSRSRSDNAIVASPGGVYILSVYTKENTDNTWKKTNQAEAAIRKLSKVIWKHYNPDSEWESPHGAEDY